MIFELVRACQLADGLKERREIAEQKRPEGYRSFDNKFPALQKG